MLYLNTFKKQETIIIRNHLLNVHPNFFTYIMVIYHTGIRPKEALALKISDVNLNRKVIVIKPNLETENSKTKTIRIVPINDHLMLLLQNHLKESYPINYYLFGSLFEEKTGNRGSTKCNKYGAQRIDYFLPSANHIKRDTPTKLWNKIIIKQLGIKKYMYALKHTGTNDKILAGIDLDALKDMYGHSSKFMTLKYATAIKDINNDKIRMLSPEF